MNPRAWESGASATPPSAPGSPSIGYATEGDPLAVIPPTNPGAFWFHALGEEIRAVIVAGGLTPTLGTLTQLRDAITAFAGTVILSGGVPIGFKIGVLKVLWGSVVFADVPTGEPGDTGTVTLPDSGFSTACLFVIPGFEVAAGGAACNDFAAAITAKTTTTFDYQVQEWKSSVNPGTLTYIAIGY